MTEIEAHIVFPTKGVQKILREPMGTYALNFFTEQRLKTLKFIKKIVKRFLSQPIEFLSLRFMY